jgi:hypothetical protein
MLIGSGTFSLCRRFCAKPEQFSEPHDTEFVSIFKDDASAPESIGSLEKPSWWASLSEPAMSLAELRAKPFETLTSKQKKRLFRLHATQRIKESNTSV